jgi:hypothetical protein
MNKPIEYFLYALFFYKEKEHKEFYKYFWEYDDAVEVAESGYILIDQKISSYDIEHHKILTFSDFYNEEELFILADKYEVV